MADLCVLIVSLPYVFIRVRSYCVLNMIKLLRGQSALSPYPRVGIVAVIP